MPVIDQVLSRSVTGKFFQAMAAYPAVWQAFTTNLDSDGASEEYANLGGPDKLREKKDENVRRALPGFTQTIVNKDYETSIEIDNNTIKDDRHDLIALKVQELAITAGNLPTEQLVGLLNTGDTDVCYDTLSFYNDSHVDKEAPYKTVQDNALTYNCSDHTAPTIAELTAAFRTARKTILGFKDEWGNPFHKGPVELITVCGAHLGNSFEEVFNATVISNTTNVLAGASKLFICPEIDSDVEFHVLVTNRPLRGLVWQVREQYRVTTLGLESEHSKKNGRCLFKVEFRGRAAYGNWRNGVITTLN